MLKQIVMIQPGESGGFKVWFAHDPSVAVLGQTEQEAIGGLLCLSAEKLGIEIRKIPKPIPAFVLCSAS